MNNNCELSRWVYGRCIVFRNEFIERRQNFFDASRFGCKGMGVRDGTRVQKKQKRKQKKEPNVNQVCLITMNALEEFNFHK